MTWTATHPGVLAQSPSSTSPGAQGPSSTGESTTSTAPANSSTSTTAPASTSSSSTSSTTSTTATTQAPGSSTTVAPAAPAPPETSSTTSTVAVAPGPSSSPAVATTPIPLSSVLVAAVVLLAVGAMVANALRRQPDRASGPRGPGAPTRPLPAVGPDDERARLPFLLEVGRAMLDAGEPVDDVATTVRRLGRVNGIEEIGTLVLPTALLISLPRGETVQTDLRAAGESSLRLDQIDQLFQVIKAAEDGEVGAAEGLAAIRAARERPPLFSTATRLVGSALSTIGLALVLRGGWLDVLVAAVLGVGVAALNLELQRRRSPTWRSLRPFWPLLVAFGVSVTVLALGRLTPELSVFPPLIAPLVAFLPGSLLTTGVLELSTGQLVSGSGRVAAGILQLVLLSIGVVAGAQLLGVPPTNIGVSSQDPAAQLFAWLGVALLGVGTFLYQGARRSSLGWMLLVLYVAYAGQVIGGAFFGGTLSAFFGAVAMTPVAVLAARQPTGPPMPVSFLPGFWLLVPGALGLQGVTRLLAEDRLGGLSALVTTGVTMVAIALGVLLGTAIGERVPALAGLRWRPGSR